MPGPPCRARAAVRGDAPPVGCRRAAPLALAPVVAGGSAACDAPAPAPRILPAVAAAPATAAWHAAMLARRALPAALAAFCTVEADERTLTGDTGSAPLARAPPPEDEPKPRFRADSLGVCANFESVVLRRRRAVGPNPCSRVDSPGAQNRGRLAISRAERAKYAIRRGVFQQYLQAGSTPSRGGGGPGNLATASCLARTGVSGRVQTLPKREPKIPNLVCLGCKAVFLVTLAIAVAGHAFSSFKAAKRALNSESIQLSVCNATHLCGWRDTAARSACFSYTI
jgi:hypothetical protein